VNETKVKWSTFIRETTPTPRRSITNQLLSRGVRSKHSRNGAVLAFDSHKVNESITRKTNGASGVSKLATLISKKFQQK